MSEENRQTTSHHPAKVEQDEESNHLLAAGSREGSPDDDVVISQPSPPFNTQRRQSSLAQSRPNGEPRTPNRVRFHEPDRRPKGEGEHDEEEEDADGWLDLDEEDYFHDGRGDTGRRGYSQRAPLLTDIQAPSVTVATEDFDPEDLLESSRPKSSMRSAFMNMANSIIGAGIIGQPYAIRQAGLLTGLVLLAGLTIVVDWTIRMIVKNCKLSGTNSYQSTVEHCFGKSGLVAISVAQWAL